MRHENAMQVEITGRQFGWIYRYPGKDNTFGKKYFRMIDEANGNSLGMLVERFYHANALTVFRT